MPYEHIFFDLDCTLWDFETNSRETFAELITKYNFKEKGIDSPEDFIEEYLIINERMWDEYRKGLVDKDTLRYKRFQEAFAKFGVNDTDFANSFANDYLHIAPAKSKLFPHTHEVLEYLQKKYILHIITNGFEEVQHIKMKSSDIEKYFKNVITSEMAGHKKPDIRIFEFSLRTANASVHNSIMIGDNMQADIIGARNANIHQVFFNPKELKHNEDVTHEIKSLNELFNLL
jgi:putative hydrolase of the HAD superfamily